MYRLQLKQKYILKRKTSNYLINAAYFFERLASATEIEVSEKYDIAESVTAVTDSARLFIPLTDLIDKEKETARLNKEIAKVQKDIDFLSGKLNNQGFISKAPEKLIEAEREKLLRAEEKMEKLKQSMKAFK